MKSARSLTRGGHIVRSALCALSENMCFIPIGQSSVYPQPGNFSLVETRRALRKEMRGEAARPFFIGRDCQEGGGQEQERKGEEMIQPRVTFTLHSKHRTCPYCNHDNVSA